MYICKDCKQEFQDKTTFLKHNWFWHKKKYSATLVEYFYNGETPLCKCGCGTEMIYRSKIGDFNEYVRGHISRIKNNFQTEKSINNSKKTIKKLNTEGKWGKNISPEKLEMLRDKMIGNKNPMFGKTHTDEVKELLSEQKKKLYLNNEEYRLAHNQRSQEYWSKEENRIAQSHRKTESLIRDNKFHPSKLEYKFAKLLEELGFKFYHQFRIRDAKMNGVFDFKIKNTKILIEVDGDFWHSNPKFYKEPTYDNQRKNVENDKRKAFLAESQNYKLVRFWEDDINNNIEVVTSQLEELKTFINDSN